MRAFIAAICAVVLAGCATATPSPNMRPLTQAHMQAIGPTNVVVDENNNGIEKSWFYTTTASAGAAYGLIGVLVTTTMDAIINAGPSRRAQQAADEMAELVPVEQLNASLVAQLRQQMPGAVTTVAAVEPQLAAGAPEAATLVAATMEPETPVPVATETQPAQTISFSGVQSAQRLMERDPLDDTIEISVSYTLSEDSSTLRVVAAARYQNAQIPYATPYTFKGSVPSAERQGPVYRNTFTYYSQQLPIPTLTLELRERLVASIQDSARDESGALPAAGTDAYNAMNRELENARDDRLTKDEIAIFLTREWLRNDGALLHSEIEQAHAFIARYLLIDMNRVAIPSMTGQDELIETMADDRTVRRIGAGVEAGSYVSSAGNVTSFSTYGNTIGIAHRNRERMSALRAASRRSH